MREQLTVSDMKKIEEEISHRKLVIRKEAIEAVKERKGVLCIIIAKMDKRILFQVMNDYENQPDLSKIFCKDYSTKGEGRGLGLYSVRSLLQEHEDMAHECKVEQGMFIQRLEIPVF